MRLHIACFKTTFTLFQCCRRHAKAYRHVKQVYQVQILGRPSNSPVKDASTCSSLFALSKDIAKGMMRVRHSHSSEDIQRCYVLPIMFCLTL